MWSKTFLQSMVFSCGYLCLINKLVCVVFILLWCQGNIWFIYLNVGICNNSSKRAILQLVIFIYFCWFVIQFFLLFWYFVLWDYISSLLDSYWIVVAFVNRQHHTYILYFFGSQHILQLTRGDPACITSYKTSLKLSTLNIVSRPYFKPYLHFLICKNARNGMNDYVS